MLFGRIVRALDSICEALRSEFLPPAASEPQTNSLVHGVNEIDLEAKARGRGLEGGPGDVPARGPHGIDHGEAVGGPGRNTAAQRPNNTSSAPRVVIWRARGCDRTCITG